MSGILLIDETPFDMRVARIEDEVVVKLAYHHSLVGAPVRGQLYMGKVTAIDKRLGAVYLDLGGSSGFLRRKGQLPQVGKLLLVEIKKEPFSGKGAEVTDKPVLRLPLMTQPVGGNARPGPIGIDDSGWEQVQANASPLQPGEKVGPLADVPALIALVTRLADGGVDVIHVTTPALRLALLPFLHGEVSVEVVEPQPVRDALGAAEEIALDRQIDLAGGGRLIIDETEALVAVDMDLGRQAGQSQKGAADRMLTDGLSALGAQALLADLGGQIVVDVPRAAIAAPKIIRDRLTRCFRPLGRVSVPAVTPEGVCVIIAPRPGPSLLDRLTAYASRSPGGIRLSRQWRNVHAAALAYRAAANALRQERTKTISLTLCAPLMRLWGAAGATEHLTRQFGARLEVKPDATSNAGASVKSGGDQKTIGSLCMGPSEEEAYSLD